MSAKDKTTDICDAETGLCAPGEQTNPQHNTVRTNHSEHKIKMTYYYDALCGWCYGFSLVVEQLQETYADKMDFEIISGGLFLGNRIAKVNEVAPYIKAGAYKTVESHSGVKFGTAFLEDISGPENIVLNSIPPAIALCIVKEKFPEKALAFASMLLHAVYYDGMNPIDTDAYAPYLNKVGFDWNEFVHKMKDEKYIQAAASEFEIFKHSPYSGMPTLVLEKGTEQILISNGYTNFDVLKRRVDSLL